MSNRIRRRHDWFVFTLAWFAFTAIPARTQTLLSAPTAQGFGQALVNTTDSRSQVLGYTFSGTTFPSFSLAYGSEYSLNSPQCTGSGSITCILTVSFQPHWPGLRQDAVLVKDTSGNTIAISFLYGTGLAPLIALSPGIISTAAGKGSWNYSGDGGSATAAALRNPQGIAIDNLGNLYVADSVNQVIRKVSAGTGLISTVAGTGTAAFSGDNNPGLLTALNNPVAIALDGAGNLYIADHDNNRIRRMSASSGLVSTVAGGGTAASGSDGLGDGGLATNAILNGPSDIAVDGAGNLYIADSFSGLIRRVDGASGRISVVAGGGTNPGSDSYGDGGPAVSARLNNPMGVALDASGNLYIADTGNNMVRRVDGSSGTITAVAGNGAYGYSGDLGLAIDAKLARPVSVRLDAAGNVYIADQGNNVIRRLNAQSGIITTLAGNGTAGYSGDGGVPASAALNAPSGVVLDSAANVYIADYANNAIRKISNPSGLTFPSTVSGEASPVQAFTVLNTGNQSLNFTALTVSPNFTQQSLGAVNCSSSTVLAPAAACTAALAFTPSASGNLSGILTFSDNSLNTSAAQSFALSGTGMAGAAPQVSFGAVSVLFPTQVMGTSSSAQSVTFSNTGSATLNISSIQLGGTNAADFSMTSNCQSTLAPQASCSVSIVFSPSAAGSRTASLTFVDNLAGSPQTVAIAGTGTLASVLASGQAHYYAGADRHVHELYFASGAWHDADLTEVAQGPNISGSAIAAVNDTIEEVFKIHYVAADQHVHQIYAVSGSWHDVDLTLTTGGPNAAAGSAIASFVDTTQSVLSVDYTAINQHIHHLYNAAGAWHDFDLTLVTGGPEASARSSIANFVDTTQNVARINYTGADQHVHEFYTAGKTWHDFDLTAATGGPDASASSSIANFVDTTQNVVRINYTGADQHVHEFYIAGGAWHDFDLTAATGGPNAAAGSWTVNLVDTTQALMGIRYAGFDQHVHNFT